MNVKFSNSVAPSHALSLCFLFAQQNEVLYEVGANSDNWMLAGRKRGHVSLSTKQGCQTTFATYKILLLLLFLYW